jgi:hypothetical protein
MLHSPRLVAFKRKMVLGGNHLSLKSCCKMKTFEEPSLRFFVSIDTIAGISRLPMV